MSFTRCIPLEERFWSKVVAREDGCWVWTGSRGRWGHGRVQRGGRNSVVLAHRVAYELLVGEIPKGLTLDHLCFNTSCVNPTHLEPVTNAENVRREMQRLRPTHCPKGHPYDEANTSLGVRPDGRIRRDCRTCARERMRQRVAA